MGHIKMKHMITIALCTLTLATGTNTPAYTNPPEPSIRVLAQVYATIGRAFYTIGNRQRAKDLLEFAYDQDENPEAKEVARTYLKHIAGYASSLGSSSGVSSPPKATTRSNLSPDGQSSKRVKRSLQITPSKSPGKQKIDALLELDTREPRDPIICAIKKISRKHCGCLEKILNELNERATQTEDLPDQNFAFACLERLVLMLEKYQH